MTFAQKLEKIGEQRGIALGEQRGIALGEQRGEKRGLEKGRQEEKRDVARKMLSNGIAPALIAQITGLTEQEIEQLKH